ncbi:MAG: SIS domain-containing protein [Gammaproteobacteria bacterium]|nr:SIS domain-containing protein [Gammaproteobacteria bacterium]MBU2056129.1 SIS domain-containing protein [Gammaproteobacteria bacterium]MBU2175685.1 SIS domain-containing protein [Gammaproteobacteria bacterium]MBU2245392.1 SIS domain-containing protein [Gammaproteobacteria bacterium]MBU2345783.1 SIS domain-containing protein [Gammaproteobacteria bacterium]
MTRTIMAQEAAEAPSRIREQLAANASRIADIVRLIKQKQPRYVYMVGRGSSDHAGVFAKYLIEIEIGLPVAAAAPSIASVYNKQLDLTGALVLVISQSGRSPDILAQVAMAKAAGALVIALVNDESSPLAEQADQVIPLNVGAEKAVAATKSYLATLSALLQLVAAWSGNSQLQDAVTSLPELLERAIELPAQLTAESLDGVKHLVVLGRGPGYAISREIALKLKEVCGIHAEAFSSAEFLHGPVTLVKDQFAIVDVSIADEANAAHQAQIAEVRSRGARIVHLHHADLLSNPRVLPLALLQRFYLDVEAVARSRGVNPDAPPGLNKVTKTV